MPLEPLTFAGLCLAALMAVWFAYELGEARELADEAEGLAARYGHYRGPVITLPDGEGDHDEALN